MRTKVLDILSEYKYAAIIAMGAAMLAFLFIRPTGAHQDPATCSGSGVSISVSAFRSDGLTPITGSDNVSAGELIKYKATLGYPGGNKCAFEGGTWTFTDPHGDVTGLGAVPEIGGGGVPSIDSSLVSYTVLAADEVSSMINATTDYVNGIVHNNVGNTGRVNASANDQETVAHAKISITPDGTNEINDTHTFTAHAQVDVGFGGGFADVADGTTIHFSIASGPGSLSPVSGDCTTAGGTGSCTIDLTSATAGVTVVNASTDITINGTTIHVTTDGSNGNSGSATKTWVDANIQISPLQDTDPINDQHTLTGHVNVNTGTGGYVDAPAGTTIHFSIASGPGSLTPVSGDCLTVLATGSCTVTLTSAVIGTTVIDATTDVVVGGVTLHRTTDGIGDNSDSAVKHWVSFTAHVTTTIHDSAHNPVTSVPAGSTVHDSATVTGTNNGDPVPTGDVEFFFYSGTSQDICAELDFTSIGTVALDGSGVAHPSAAQGPLDAGTYAFKAHYEADTNYPDGAISDCEPLTVTQKEPTLGTTPSAGGDIGVVLNDTATLAGAYNPTGSITFNLYPPSNATCDGSGIYMQVVALTGNSAATSPGFTSNAAGVWHWTADYPGDLNNKAASSGCEAEPVTINQPAGQYCSPGYWKQEQHFDSYVNYNPTDLFDDVFGRAAFPDKTLVQVLSTGGGGLIAYSRATVGALLNADAINSGLTPAQVIAKFQATFDAAPSSPKGAVNSYYGGANPEFTAPENCPLN
jgi:hypothetical protein